MNVVLKRMLLLSVLTPVGLLSACGSSEKDYSNAKPLATINTTLKVTPLWAEPTGDVPKNAHAQLPVNIDHGRIYLADKNGGVAVLNAENGDSIWRENIGEALSGGPGVGNKRLFVATREAELIALDKDTGAEKWRQRVSSEMLATPVVVENQVIVQTIDGAIAAYDTDTGTKKWVYTRTTPKLTLRGTSEPLVIGDKVLAGFSDGRLVGLNLSTGELLWEATIATPRGRTDLERLVDIDGLFKTTGDIVYASSFQGRVAALSLSSGSVLWARDMSSYTGLAIGNDQVIVTDAESKVWALDGRTGATLWRQDNLMGRELSTPAVVGKNVVVADFAGFVHWLSSDDGQFVARNNLTASWEKLQYVWDDEEQEEERHRSVSVYPLALGNTVYVRDNIGALTVFQIAP